MPRTRECDYCSADIEPGTGTMLVHNNGSTTHFCSSKCENNADLGREARNLGWTESGRDAKPEAETADTSEVDEEVEAVVDEDWEAQDDSPDEDWEAQDDEAVTDDDIETESDADDGSDDAETESDDDDGSDDAEEAQAES